MTDPTFRSDETFALELDRADPLAGFRRRFHLPQAEDGTPLSYLSGNSLGLQPLATAEVLRQALDDWARLGVEGHFRASTPWYTYHERFRPGLARLVGAEPHEVVAMNGLTANLHLMMVSFYRPTAERHKILMEDSAFPSDTYAVSSQLAYHGFDPDRGRIVVRGAEGEGPLHAEAIEEALDERGDEIALVLLPGVQYFTGQRLDMRRIAAAARERGCVVGLDLAHAVGNVPLALHDWNVDFAVWCSYKYLNAGPGAPAGCFVHERHARDTSLGRFAGWWGNDPAIRFRMHLEPHFTPRPSADGWQLSNPPILALAPLGPALELFDEAGLPALREKSKLLTGYLESWIDRLGRQRVRSLTPRDPAARGCQLSLAAVTRPREMFAAVQAAGIVADFREPDVVRAAPVPLYNSFHDVWRLGSALESWSRAIEGGA